ncbi:MAG: response regulator transcription factor [Myxococcota bacterium]
MSEEPVRILVVEDDPSIQLGLRMNLQRAGYEVTLADDGFEALELLRREAWSLCILDIMLPRLNGLEVLEQVRRENLPAPVLVLSARGEEHDKVVGLDLGAEDYVTKPFSVPELMARVRATLRRRSLEGGSRPSSRVSFRFGDVEIDTSKREVIRAGTAVELTATEFNILHVLARAQGTALSRDAIFVEVWGRDHHGTRRTIDNFIAQLRNKLEADPAHPTLLKTVRGVGYRLDPEGAPSSHR